MTQGLENRLNRLRHTTTVSTFYCTGLGAIRAYLLGNGFFCAEQFVKPAFLDFFK